jgi:hypothetical protein
MQRQKGYHREERESFEAWKDRHKRMLDKDHQPLCE